MNSIGFSLVTPSRWTGWQLWLLLLLCEGLMTWYMQTNIITREAYHALFSEQLEGQRIDDLFDFYKQMEVWGFAVMPLFIWIRITFISFLLQMPLLLRFIDIPFRDLFRIVALASLWLVLMQAGRLVYLSSLSAGELTAEKLTYVPLSLGSLIKPMAENASSRVMLSHFNLFALGYLLTLYHGLMQSGRLKKTDSALVVLFIWTLILVMQWAIVLIMNKRML